MGVWVYVCMCVCVYVGICVCVYVCMGVCVHVCMCVYVYVCMCVCVYEHVFVPVYMHVHVYVYVHVYVHVYVQVYAYAHVLRPEHPPNFSTLHIPPMFHPTFPQWLPPYIPKLRHSHILFHPPTNTLSLFFLPPSLHTFPPLAQDEQRGETLG